jgi:hypothetical protein
MMKVKADYLRKHVEEVKVRHLQSERQLEYYEFLIEQCGEHNLDVSIATKQMEEVRDANREARVEIRKYVETLEKILCEDEAANSWKGEDRYIDLS